MNEKKKEQKTPIRLIDMESFRKLNSFPRYPENADICVLLDDVDIANTLIVFISHCWLRGSSEADGWDGRPHPDNANADKFKLCLAGIDKISKFLAPGMDKVMVWLDFGCMDQDGDPAGELKQLDDIVRCTDILFTPMHGHADVPALVKNYYTDYKTPAWNADGRGYINRGWCRVEMFYASNIPVDVDSGRLEKFRSGLRFHASNGVRPHLLYGTREHLEDLPPIILSPLRNTYFNDFDPAKGCVTMDTDSKKIRQLVAQLRPYMKCEVIGYKGDTKDGKQHGRGVYRFACGDIYEGDFVNGKQHGQGVYRFTNGNVYEGEYVENKMQGHGVYRAADGCVYDGEWVDGKKHGHGVWIFSNGNSYRGEFAGNKIHGLGVYRFADGSFYEGEYVCGKRHGKGLFSYANGSVYEGQFLNDKRCGHGVFRYANESVYERGYVDGKVHGQGVFGCATGNFNTEFV